MKHAGAEYAGVGLSGLCNKEARDVLVESARGLGGIEACFMFFLFWI